MMKFMQAFTMRTGGTGLISSYFICSSHIWGRIKEISLRMYSSKAEGLKLLSSMIPSMTSVIQKSLYFSCNMNGL